MMSKYQRTEFSNEDLSASNFLEQNNILFSKQAFVDKDKRRRSSGSSLKNKLNSNLVDKLAMDKNCLSKSNLNKKSNLIGLNSITNPIHGDLNEPLTEIELDNDDSSSIGLDGRLANHKAAAAGSPDRGHSAAGSHSATSLNTSINGQSTTGLPTAHPNNPHELSNMKRMLVSLETNLENGSNLNRSYLYSTNTLAEPEPPSGPTAPDAGGQTAGDNQPRLLGLMNAVHLNHCSNNNFATTPNVSFFGLQNSSIDPSGNVLFGNIGKFKSNARFGSFFRKIKFIWHRATLLERLFGIFIFLLLLTICYLSITVLSLQTLNKNLEEAAIKRKHVLLNIVH